MNWGITGNWEYLVVALLAFWWLFDSLEDKLEDIAEALKDLNETLKDKE